MNKQSKVENIKTVTVSGLTDFVNVTVAEGKLILIQCDMENALLSHHDACGYEPYNYKTFGAIRGGAFNYYTLIVISETENIVEGDAWVNTADNTLGIHYSATKNDVEQISKRKAANSFLLNYCKKILALPEQIFLSPEVFSFIDRNVLIECHHNWINGDNTIKFDNSGHVILHNIGVEEPTYKRSMVLSILKDFANFVDPDLNDRRMAKLSATEKWFEKHVK